MEKRLRFLGLAVVLLVLISCASSAIPPADRNSQPNNISIPALVTLNESYPISDSSSSFEHMPLSTDSKAHALPLFTASASVVPEEQSLSNQKIVPSAALPTQKPDKQKTAYLTFDDGPAPKGDTPARGTSKLLDLLKKHQIKATFFLLGGRVNAYPGLVRRIVSEGHIIGNHTWSHVDAAKVTGNPFAWQVRHTNDVIFKVTGVRPKLFRPPYGAQLDRSQWGALSKNGLKAVWWTLDTMDWNPSFSDGKVLRQIQYGIDSGKDLVILYHDHSFRMLEEAISLLEKNGYAFDTLDHKRLQ